MEFCHRRYWYIIHWAYLSIFYTSIMLYDNHFSDGTRWAVLRPRHARTNLFIFGVGLLSMLVSVGVFNRWHNDRRIFNAESTMVVVVMNGRFSNRFMKYRYRYKFIHTPNYLCGWRSVDNLIISIETIKYAFDWGRAIDRAAKLRIFECLKYGENISMQWNPRQSKPFRLIRTTE